MKKTILYIGILLTISFYGKGQDEIASFLTTGTQDMEKLSEAYLEPFGKGFGVAMNSGWYNTAKPHKLLGFDVTINASLVSVPAEDQSFDLDTYTWNVLHPGDHSETPTIAGDGQGASVGVQNNEGQSAEDVYTLPGGTGFSYVPLPMMQVGVGLIKGTDIQFRFFPELEFSDYGKIGMFGVGLRHDFKQWIPGLNKLPFDMSVQGAWSQLMGTYNKVEFYPVDYLEGVDINYVGPIPHEGENDRITNEYYRTQDLTLTTRAWNANLIVSKKLSVVTGFASIGYAASTFNIGLNGKYLIPTFDYNSDSGNIEANLDSSNEKIDPVDVDIEYKSINTSIGLRLQLALLSVHAAYVYQDYSIFNFGIGVSFR